MKSFFYSVYAVIFNILRIFPLKLNKAAFLSPHNENFHDSLGAVMNELVMRDEFNVVKISCTALNIDKSSVKALFKSIASALSFFTVKAYHLATAKFVFMNDNFMPMNKLNFSDKAVITQLWHAEGAFKKFGLHTKLSDDVEKIQRESSKKLSYIVCSSKSVADIYSQAFGVSGYKVLPLGSARTDYFFKKVNEKRLRELFDKQYPECKGKKLVLYAPTFRDNAEDDARLLESVDFKAFDERFGSEYKLLIRLHPQVHTSVNEAESAVDVSDYDDVSELLRITDILITDYSSVCMDFALMEKPIYFYAFDLDKYENDRSFYYDYESYVPGPVARDFQTLLNLMAGNIIETYRKRMYNFKFINFGNPDGKAAQRIVDRIVYNKEIEM